MSTNRKGSNQRLREKIDTYLKEHGEIETYTFIKTLPQKYYALTPGRVAALVREREDVQRIKSNRWTLKCE